MKSEQVIRLKLHELRHTKAKSGIDHYEKNAKIEILEWVLS